MDYYINITGGYLNYGFSIKEDVVEVTDGQTTKALDERDSKDFIRQIRTTSDDWNRFLSSEYFLKYSA